MNRRNIFYVLSLNLRSNKLFILIALCLIPVLYSSLNLWAVSTVYDNTKNIAVAVVNNDRPVTIDHQRINIGGELVKNLKKNHDLDWSFVTEDQANAGLLGDRYYAAFVIPPDFSQKITSVATGKPVKPQIVYKVNNKLSGFGTKVTGSAKNSLQNQISNSFVSTASGAVGQSLSHAGSLMKGHEYELLAFKYLVIDTDQNMDSTVANLDAYKSKAEDMGSAAESMQSVLPAMQNINETLEDMNRAQAGQIASADGSADSVGMILDYSGSQISRIQQAVAAIENNTKPAMSAGDIDSQIDSVIAGLDKASMYLSNVEAAGNEAKLQKVISDLTALQSEISATDTQLGSLYDTIQSAKGGIASAAGKLNAPLAAAISALETLNGKLSELASELTALGQTTGMDNTIIVGQIDAAISLNSGLIRQLEQTQADLNGGAGGLLAALNQAQTDITAVRQKLAALSDAVGRAIQYASMLKAETAGDNAHLTNVISSLNGIASYLQDEKTRVDTLSGMLGAAGADAARLKSDLENDSSAVSAMLQSARSEYRSKVSGYVNQINSGLLRLDADNAQQNAAASAGIRQIGSTLTLQKNLSDYLSDCFSNLKAALLQSKPQIHTLSTRLNDVSDASILNLMHILETGSMNVVEDFAHPIDVSSETVYTIPDNSSNMSALYTVISLWLGAYILATGLKRTRENTLLFRSFGRVEGYLGQLLTFSFMSVIQAYLIALADIYITRIYVCSKPLFTLFCMFISLIFSIIIFSLVELFGRVGKSLCAVYMIFQLTGSGGSYPTQVLPPALQALHSLLPFTYAINGLREAVSGPTLFNMMINTAMLLLFGTVFFAVGLKGNRLFADRVYANSQAFQDCGLGR